MTAPPDFDLFLVAAPGLEDLLCAEAAEKGFHAPTAVQGGVTVTGGWPEVWRANLELRGATRVLVRLAEFRAMHLAQLDKRARKVPWADVLGGEALVQVEATCRKSRIYHDKAAAERIARAIADGTGAPIVTAAAEAAIRLKVRIFDDLCTISLDSSGESLHKRGHKQAVNKAPMRETLAALFLRYCGYDGTEPVIDPMCGSGTFVLEAAEIAAGLQPGRSRAFAFEHLKTFDATAWTAMRTADPGPMPSQRFYGFDRDQGAVAMSLANAERAGVAAVTTFAKQPISDLVPPDGPPGLVIVNPPYGTRVGKKKPLPPLYQTLGQVLTERFAGWRVGLVTNTDALARSTGLPFVRETAPVPHGGLKVKLYATGPLA